MAVDATRSIGTRIAGIPIPDAVRVAGPPFWWSRALIFAISMFAVAIFGYDPRHPLFDPQGFLTPFGHVGNTLLAPSARWDARWYIDIAQNGYGGDPHRLAAFFPLYPLMVAGGAMVTGSTVLTGIVISLAFGWAGLALLHRLTEIELGSEAARHTVTLMAFSPMAFFLSAIYTESLFLTLSVGAVLAARTGRWPWAMVCGILAAATRNLGVLLIVPLALLWWQRRDPRRDLLWIVPIPLGLLAFCAWLVHDHGSFKDPFNAPKTYWFRNFDGPFSAAKQGIVAAWDGARQLLHRSRTPVYFKRWAGDPYDGALHNLSNFVFLIPIVPMFIGAVRRLPLAYWAYTFLALLLALSYPVSSEPLISLPRYELVVFPLFMWLGWWVSRGSQRRRVIVYGICIAGLVFYTGRFATWHWVA